MPQANVSNWDPYHNRLQGNLRDGNFINGQFILLCAGPPYLNQLTNSSGVESFNAYPIGLTQNLSISQNKSISRVFEIGSDRSYFIPGRSVGQLTLGRVIYHGPSLLRVLYATYGSDISGGGGNTAGVPIPSLMNGGTSIGVAPFVADPTGGVTKLNYDTGTIPSKPLHTVQVAPGYDNMFLNLASDLFNNPTGLLLMMKDSEQNLVAAGYFENCYVPTHSMALDSQGLIMQESVGIQYERFQPMSVTPRVGLIQGVLSDSTAWIPSSK